MNNCQPLWVIASLVALTAANPAAGATETADGSFVFSFDITNFTATDSVSLDPFSGTTDQLTGVTLDFVSNLIVSENDATESSVAVQLDGDTVGILLNPSPGSQEFSFSADLLALGFDASLFVGGPVVFDLSAFSDEGNITALWYAGQGVPFLGLDPFGEVTLTYEFEGSVPMPVSGGLLLFTAGFTALAGLGLKTRLRRRSAAVQRQSRNLPQTPRPS